MRIVPGQLVQVIAGNTHPGHAGVAVGGQLVLRLQAFTEAQHVQLTRGITVELSVHRVLPRPVEHLHDAQALLQHLVDPQRLRKLQVAIEVLQPAVYRLRPIVAGRATHHSCAACVQYAGLGE
ncbi:hypothetical protein D3C80_1268270 [compost metagenome]